MKALKDQRGIGHLLLLAALAVVTLVGVAGYRVVNTADTGSSDSVSISSSSAGEVKEIKSKADLQKADNSLDNTAIDGSVNPNQLDHDLNALL